MTKLFLLSIFNQCTVAAVSPYLQIILRNKGYSHSLVGVIVALCQAASIIIPMMVSAVADKVGRTKPFIIGCALLSGLLCIPFVYSSVFAVAVLAAILMNGIYWCLNPMTDGYANRMLHGDTSRYGFIRAAGTMSYVVTLTSFGIFGFPVETDNKSILLCTLMALSALLIVSFFMEEKKPQKTEKTEKRQFFNAAWFPRKFYVFMVAVAFTRVSQVIFDKLLASYMTEELGLGKYFTIFIALGAFIEFFCMILGGRILKKGLANSWTLMMVSSFGMIARLLLYLLPGIVPFAIAQCFHGLTFGIFHVAVTDYIAKNVDPEHYEMGMTIYWSVATNLPQMIGAFLGGYVIQYLGYPMLFTSYTVFPIIAVFILLFNKKLIQSEGRA
ncbi:MAG: MFS transporter [Spirochaetales bacterium]|nr:MFS transporter [Candidatus Physcosoma equi]